MSSLSMAAGVERFPANLPADPDRLPPPGRCRTGLARWERSAPASAIEHADRASPLQPIADEGRDRRAVAEAIVTMLRDGTAAFSFPLVEVAPDRDPGRPWFCPSGEETNCVALDRAAEARRAEWGSLADGRKVTFSAVGELKRTGSTVALVVRLVQAPQVTIAAPPSRPAAGLPKWRLKRAIGFIKANLENPITLNEVADAAGLSPNYFAAQFRLATGLRPHEYILRERIHRAQEMLLDPNATPIEIALSVGFQTQAHFTTVFKRIVGDTPAHWRRHRPGRLDGVDKPAGEAAVDADDRGRPCRWHDDQLLRQAGGARR